MRIPSNRTCYRLILEMEMMDHIVDHSRRVRRVALFLVDRLAERGISLNRDLVSAAALLHDITKTRSFETGENHARTGAQYLGALGYPEVGDIVGQHVKLRNCDPVANITEAVIVNYADKRVLHDRVVSLAERMDYILKRYGRDSSAQAHLFNLWKITIEIENRLFAHLPFTPDDLAHLLER